MNKPKVIFLDAVGTLFGVKGSVGEVYGTIAASFGVYVAPTLLNEAFYQSFKASPALAFPNVELSKVPQLEFLWWKVVAYSTFTQVGVIEQFINFDDFFGKLYDYFAQPEPWIVYPDVIKSLIRWQNQGIELGIISNFDSRIYSVLKQLNLADYFSSVTISSEVGFAKPHQQIFTIALDKHDCLAEQAWYIGDSLTEDYYGAKAIGMNPFLIKRS
ncbi:hydrolase [Aphanothece hegewaldii CCALA 016]|uniref:Hydrolase n=1 Tax=Aphanothece hegewaldii CCALA 016 TaxID=2107694 RepID=A0A2T1M3W2_9CHRO|nr:HAD family hydrolase [Aphanothece hegewaldii]PSF39508.1 hydrolase [Aphanothece hegewaldii CCALA 016]